MNAPKHERTGIERRDAAVNQQAFGGEVVRITERDKDDTYVSMDLMKEYLKDIGRVPLLTVEQEAALSEKIEAGVYAKEILAGRQPYTLGTLGEAECAELQMVIEQGDEAFENFAEANLRLVVSIAKQWHGRNMELLDLVQDGSQGLIRAIQKFDHTRGNKFSTYATPWIKQALQRATSQHSRTIRLPVHIDGKHRIIYAIRARLLSELGREPTDEEILTGNERLTPDDITEYHRIMRQTVVSLNGALGEDGELGDIYGKDTISPGPEAVTVERALGWAIERAFSILNEREVVVITRRYGLSTGKGETYDAIAADLGVTRERIRQIERGAIGKLSHPSVGGGLHEFLVQ